MNKLTGYLGTYASPESLGIYRFTLDLEQGVLSQPELYYNALDCKYLSLNRGFLAAPVKREGRAGICLLDVNGPHALLKGEDFQEEGTACYVTQDSTHICTGNYHEGSVLVYEKTPEGPKLLKRIDIGPKAGCHQILFHGPYMLVSCLLLDAVKVYDCAHDFSPAGELKFPQGTGPRHAVFDREHRRLFLVSELSNQVFVYAADQSPSHEVSHSPNSSSGTEGVPFLHLQNVYSILPDGEAYPEPPASAAVRLSPDERFLYVSTRFAEVITVYAIEGTGLRRIQQTGCGGNHPRDIIITPDGRYLLSVNRTQGGLVCFRLDPKSGQLLDLCSRVPAPEAVSIVLSGPND